MAVGTDINTGARISGLVELKQRIARLLRTRKGSLPFARRYGCNLPYLVDGKITEQFKVSVFAEAAVALAEPENGIVDDFVLNQVVIDFADNVLSVNLLGDYLLEGKKYWIDGVVLA